MVFHGYLFHKIEFQAYEDKIALKRNLDLEIDNIYAKYNISSEEIAIFKEHRELKVLDFNPLSLSKSCYFAMWMETTIGYGFWMPDTRAGEYLCCLGFPLMVIFFTICYRYNLLLKLMVEDLIIFQKPWVQNVVLYVWQPLHVIALLITYNCAYSKMGWDFWDCWYFIYMSNTTIGMVKKYPAYEWHPALFCMIAHCFMINVGFALEKLEILQNTMKNQLLQIDHRI